MGDFQQLPTVSGVPRFLSSILAFVVNAAAVLLSVVVVVCFSYAVQGGLICREPSPVACGIHKPCRLLTGIKKVPLLFETEGGTYPAALFAAGTGAIFSCQFASSGLTTVYWSFE